MLGPVIKGEKVWLEPAREEFLAAFIQWFGDTEVTRYLAYRTPPSIKQEQEWFDGVAQDRNTVHWAITLDGRPIGVSGIHQIDWINRWGITGTMIGERAEWGKGYGSEATKLRTRFAFDELNLERLQTHSVAVNRGMHKALERSGYRKVGTMSHSYFRDGQWLDAYLFELLRSDWLEQGRGGVPTD